MMLRLLRFRSTGISRQVARFAAFLANRDAGAAQVQGSRLPDRIGPPRAKISKSIFATRHGTHHTQCITQIVLCQAENKYFLNEPLRHKDTKGYNSFETADYADFADFSNFALGNLNGVDIVDVVDVMDAGGRDRTYKTYRTYRQRRNLEL